VTDNLPTITPSNDVWDWSYEPLAPFVVQYLPESLSLVRIIVTECDTLDQAVDAFFKIGLPMRPRYRGTIIDASRRRVLMWSTTDLALNTHPCGLWTGVSKVFERMEAIDVANPIDRAIWESLAHRSAA
jgi:hypothetical protein